MRRDRIEMVVIKDTKLIFIARDATQIANPSLNRATGSLRQSACPAVDREGRRGNSQEVAH